MMLAASMGMWGGVALLAVMAVLWAALLRWVRLPGWSIVGGLVAGLLLGPTILGQTLPGTFDALFGGGAAAREALADEQHAYDRLRFVLEEAGASAEAINEVREQEAQAIAPLEQAVADAVRVDRQAMVALTIVAVSVLMMCTGLVGVPASEHRHSMAWPLNIGGWAAVVPGALSALLLWWGNEPVPACLSASAALMIGPWALTPIDRKAADDVELGGARMIQAAGRVASVLAIITWLAALAMAGGFMLAMMGMPIAAMMAGWIAPPVRGHWLRRSFEHSAVPIVTACAAVHVDFIHDLSFWSALLFLVVSGDGRWLGAMIGASALGGRRGLRSMRLVLGSMAAGPSQAAVAAMGAQLDVLPDHLVVAALMGAVLIEVATPARRKVAERIQKTEQEIDELMEGEE